MEQEEEDAGDWPPAPQRQPPPPSRNNRNYCLSMSGSGGLSSSKMPIAFIDAAARFDRNKQTLRADTSEVASSLRRSNLSGKLLILGLVAFACAELFSSAGRIDLSKRQRDDNDNERLRQLAHCPAAVCPPAASSSLAGRVGRVEISNAPANRFGPLLVFAAAAELDQSLNTSASGGGQLAEPNNNNNNETTTQAAAASDLPAKVATAAATAGGATHSGHQDQQQQAKNQVDLNFTRPTTAGDSDLPLIIMTKRDEEQRPRQEGEQQQQQGDLTTTAAPRPGMTSVVCNSRCRCLQLELFGISDYSGGGKQQQNGNEQTERGGQQRARDKMPTSGSSSGLVGWLAKLGGGPSASSEQIESMVTSRSSDSNNNEIASDTNSSRIEQDEAAAALANSNKIALIEFGRDYSFDELDEFERAGQDEPGEQTTAGTGNENHHPGPAAAAASAPLLLASTHQKRTQQSQLASTSGNHAQQLAAPANIKHANDQSKDVNVSTTPAGTVTTASSSSTPTTLTLLSIKDNKTGAQQHPTMTSDRQVQLQGTLYPHYLSMAAQQHHNPRQRHKQLMPAAFNQQMSAHSFGAQQQQQDEDEERALSRVARILPLRALNLTRDAGQLSNVETIVQMLKDVEAQSVQSLSLSYNKLTFETWTQLYGLLAPALRRHIYHLDLSHNSLAKLGVTFTGYIEHHLAHQLLVQHNQTWPFASPPAHQNQSTAARPPSSSSSPPSAAESSSALNEIHHQTATTRATRVQKQHQKLMLQQQQQQQQLRHPNLGEGKLYNSVRSALPLNVSAILLQPPAAATHDVTSEKEGTVAQSAVRRKSLQGARMAHTILHLSAKVKALDLSYNKLEWLINDQFRVLKHVESIRLDHNQIRYIHQQAFNGLEELKYLNLNYNRIQTIYMEQFQTNFNLRALFLQSNYLTYLRADSLAALDRLKRLDLSRNKFSLLSNNAFAGLDSLEFLNLSSNQFVHVPSTSFHSLAAANLRELDLSRNQLAQLMPGTFFHLKLVRLWLDENAQLVAIDRGAFWDLPHLSELSLRSNKMLLNINSQAFVGLPNIRTINYDECPLLDADTKQMLDNVTQAATLRHLIQVKQPTGGSLGSGAPPAQLASVNGTTGGNESAAATFPAQFLRQQHEHMRLQMGVDRTQQLMAEAETGADRGGQTVMKFVYSTGCLVFIVIALKLVFSFTSTGRRRLSEERRRRRRVYQSSASSLSSATGGADDSLSCSPSVAVASSSAANYCDDELPPPPPGCMGGFEMCEQQPQGALTAGGREPASRQQDQPTSDHQPGGDDATTPPTCCDDLSQLQVVAAAAAQGADGCPCPDCCAQVIGSESATTGGFIDQGNESETFQGNSFCDISTTTTNANGAETMSLAPTGAVAAAPDEASARSQEQDSAAAIELIHDQLVAAGYGDYGHAECAHFYQSLGPALQLADLTASLVNQMDYYS